MVSVEAAAATLLASGTSDLGDGSSVTGSDSGTSEL